MQLVGKTFKVTHVDGTTVIVFVARREHVNNTHALVCFRYTGPGRYTEFRTSRANMLQAIRQTGAAVAQN